jgi:hypothetical protein
VGTAYWRNATRGYDAAMLVINAGRMRVSAFAASQVQLSENGLSHHQAGNNLHGIYASVRSLGHMTVVEPYVLWRVAPGFRTESGLPASLDRKTVGVHWAGALLHFDYDAEISGQGGRTGDDRIAAWSASFLAGRTLASGGLRPRVFVKYDFASGDRNPNDGRRGTFDQLYPNMHDQHGLADQVGRQNVHSARAGVRLSLRANWMVTGAYNEWWLANPRDAFYNSSGGVVARDVSGQSGRHIGREFDAQSCWRWNRHVEFGAGIAYIRSGEFLRRTGLAPRYVYPYVMLNYNVF